MPDSSPTTASVAASMDERYRAGTAYQSELVFDKIRTEQIRRAVLDLCRTPLPTEYELTLDVGCGVNGIACFWPHKNIIATDISAEAIKQAKEKNPDPEYLVGPIETVDLQDYRFGVSVAQESIEHWVNVGKGLDNIRAHMNDQGIFVLSTPNRDSLHCRMARKFGREAPRISPDHVHEFGFLELIQTVCDHGFQHEEATGVHLAPYWALEDIMGHQFRNLTDNDPEVNQWLNDLGSVAPAYSFIQVHRFRAV